MALRDLNAAAMIEVTDQWLQQDRGLIESQPALLYPLELIEEAHHTLLTTQKRIGTVEKHIMELTRNLTAEDAYHDRKLRGTFMMLSGAAEIEDDPDERERLLNARDTLFPLGLAATQRTYREQAGNGKIAREQFKPDVQASCDQLQINGRPLSGVVYNWLDSSQRIGDMNALRNRISGDGDDGVAAGELHQARLIWIKAVNAMLAMLEFTDFDADTRRRLLADLRDAETKAAKSRANASQAKAEDKAEDTEQVLEDQAYEEEEDFEYFGSFDPFK